MEICNACRCYEGFCAVFPAVELRREFTTYDLSYLANLCHNCRSVSDRGGYPGVNAQTNAMPCRNGRQLGRHTVDQHCG